MTLQELLQNSNTLILLAGCCVGLFLFGGIIGFVLQILGIGFGIVGGVLEFIVNIVSGGPIAWCGCLVLLFACAGCGGLALLIASVLPQCGTPQAVNLCRLFGY
ncbi:MAG: hypothetical protein MUE40_04915 [Anaerolineae bacterium]|jgi:hypothetical protein|nr:hypothetical protein [Anaerolineae bacterium]